MSCMGFPRFRVAFCKLSELSKGKNLVVRLDAGWLGYFSVHVSGSDLTEVYCKFGRVWIASGRLHRGSSRACFALEAYSYREIRS